MHIYSVVPKSFQTSIAIQWKKENAEEITDYLTKNNIAFSYHEINSGGELILYATNYTRQVSEGEYIIISTIYEGEEHQSIDICSESWFKIGYDIIGKS